MKPPSQRTFRLAKDLLDVATVPNPKWNALTLATELKDKQRRGIQHDSAQGENARPLVSKAFYADESVV